ncbi:MAG TPA: HEAT repeat domain-containing protein [Myxococcaceae bacterium]|nr:HEAT repeat domain-containing protein [Myxococcaceae bacterium]
MTGQIPFHSKLRGLALAVLLGLALTAEARSPEPPRTPACRTGYLGFEQGRGLEGLRLAARQASERGDEAELGFLSERLTELIGKDPAAALQVVGWAETATEPQLSLYLRAVREAEAVREPTVAARLLSLAETAGEPGRQVMALVALETQHRLEPEHLERLKVIARQDGRAAAVAGHAVRTVGRVMEASFQRTGRLEPYVDTLLEVAGTSAEPLVRGLAVEMLGYPDARLESAAVTQLATLMKKDPVPLVRELAALVLSSGRDTQAVLGHFREAFAPEKERCVRWALVRYAVRAGGAQALPLLRDFARIDPRFQPDAADFQSLYGAGHVDFNRVWLNKRVRHPTCDGSGP